MTGMTMSRYRDFTTKKLIVCPECETSQVEPTSIRMVNNWKNKEDDYSRTIHATYTNRYYHEPNVVSNIFCCNQCFEHWVKKYNGLYHEDQLDESQYHPSLMNKFPWFPISHARLQGLDPIVDFHRTTCDCEDCDPWSTTQF